jgi:hypothetical protein
MSRSLIFSCRPWQPTKVQRNLIFINEMRKCQELPATVVISNAAHGMQRLNADVFNKVTLEFLSKH